MYKRQVEEDEEGSFVDIFSSARDEPSSPSIDGAESVSPQPVQENPFILKLSDVHGARTEIIAKERDCVVFVSARFCKTCKAIDPKYTRMARLADERSSTTAFAKAEASGPSGKELGRFLGVEAVPVFVLFRAGERFGTPLSTNKLPSKKIDAALELLESGRPWDARLLEDGP